MIKYSERELLLLTPRQIQTLCDYYGIPLSTEDKKSYKISLQRLREGLMVAHDTEIDDVTGMPISSSSEPKMSARVKRIYESTHKKE